MKFLISIGLFFLLTPALADNHEPEFFERPHFSFSQGNMRFRPGVDQSIRSTYKTGPKKSTVTNKAQWNTLNREQTITNADGQPPYRLEIRSSTTNPGDYLFMEGGASSAQQGRSESELIVTEVKDKRITARTRCSSKYTEVTEANEGVPGIALMFDLGMFNSLTQSKKDQRELMDCTTVTPQFCQDINNGINAKQMKSCLSTMKAIANKNPNDWRELKAKERQLTDNWLMPFAENFYGNVNTPNKRNPKNSLDTTQLRKYTGFTDKDTNSFVNLVKDCEIFNFNKPIANAEVNPAAAGVQTRKNPVETGL